MPPPNPINEQTKCQESLASVYLPGDMLRDIRPPLPQIQLLPPTMGYGDPADAISIDDCFRATRDPMTRYDFSGSQGAYSATSTPSQGVW